MGKRWLDEDCGMSVDEVGLVSTLNCGCVVLDGPNESVSVMFGFPHSDDHVRHR